MIPKTTTFFIFILVLTLTINSANSLKKFKTQDNCFTPDINRYTFNSDWSFTNGSPILSFKAMGSDILIILADEKKEGTAEYTVTIAGWNNTRSKVTAGRKVICDFPGTAALDTFTEYSIVFSSKRNKISLVINDDLIWACEDEDGFHAKHDGYFGFSRSSGHSLKICDVDIKDNKEHTPHYHLAMTKTVR
jgi:hypothetical protein